MGVLKEGQTQAYYPAYRSESKEIDDALFLQSKGRQHRQTRSKRNRQRLVRMTDKENELNDALTSVQCRCSDDDDVTTPCGSPSAPASKDPVVFPVYENILFSEACVAAREGNQQQQVAGKVAAGNECYYDVSLAQKCHKLLHQQAGKCPSTRVMLFPEEEWAKNAPGIQWSIKMNRWWKRYCTVTETRAGGRRVISSVGKVTQNRDGTLTIAGHFKRNKDPDFRLHLSARVTKDDFERGYVMTGALQLGDLKGEGRMEITHFAVVPRYQTEDKDLE